MSNDPIQDAINTELDTQTVIMTPELAATMLGRNEANRTVSKSKVRSYADKMTMGLWRLTHQGIAVDKDGNILDGQHRLMGVVSSGCVVPMRVTFNADRSTFDSIDNGMTRQAGQILGVPNAHQTAAALRILYCVEIGMSLNAAGSVPNEIVTEMLRRYPEAVEAAHLSSNTSIRRVCPPGPHTAVIIQALRSPYADRVTEWITGLSEGVGLSPTSPVLHLRNRFIRQTARQVGGSTVVYGLISKAWNAHAEERRMGVLKWNSTEGVAAVSGFKPADSIA